MINHQLTDWNCCVRAHSHLQIGWFYDPCTEAFCCTSLWQGSVKIGACFPGREFCLPKAITLKKQTVPTMCQVRDCVLKSIHVAAQLLLCEAIETWDFFVTYGVLHLFLFPWQPSTYALLTSVLAVHPFARQKKSRPLSSPRDSPILLPTRNMAWALTLRSVQGPFLPTAPSHSD